MLKLISKLLSTYTKIMFKSGFIWNNFSQSKLKRVCKRILNNFFEIGFLEPYVLTKNPLAFLTHVTRIL